MAHALSLGKMFFGVAAIWLVISLGAEPLLEQIEHSSYNHLLEFLLPFVVFTFASFASTYLAERRPLPSFVVAVFIGQACKPLLEGIVANGIVLEGIVTLLATLILFQGGLETPLQNFRRLFPKIFMLAFPGVLITALGLAWAAYQIGGATLSFTTVVLLGAILASTDPAAVIPLFKTLRFRNTDSKDIAVSESAVNDVVGALLFFTFLGAVEASGNFTGIGQGFATLFSADSGTFLLKQLAIGTIVGVAGWGLLQLYSVAQARKELSKGARGVALLTVPIGSFFVAAAFGGSGYLAAFVAGLLFHVSHERETDVEHYGENFIDGFAKPIIFVLLGAMVNLADLQTYAVHGILIALVFIFLLRPLMAHLMLSPFVLFGKNRMTWNQVRFLSWIRETGAIPAVLLVTVVSKNIPGLEAVLPIGMWAILATLILQPALTPWVAKKLGIADPVSESAIPTKA